MSFDRIGRKMMVLGSLAFELHRRGEG